MTVHIDRVPPEPFARNKAACCHNDSISARRAATNEPATRSGSGLVRDACARRSGPEAAGPVREADDPTRAGSAAFTPCLFIPYRTPVGPHPSSRIGSAGSYPAPGLTTPCIPHRYDRILHPALTRPDPSPFAGLAACTSHPVWALPSSRTGSFAPHWFDRFLHPSPGRP